MRRNPFPLRDQHNILAGEKVGHRCCLPAGILRRFDFLMFFLMVEVESGLSVRFTC